MVGAGKRLVPSMTTLAGLVKHLRWIEVEWFQQVLARRSTQDLPPLPWSDGQPDADFRVHPDESWSSSSPPTSGHAPSPGPPRPGTVSTIPCRIPG